LIALPLFEFALVLVRFDHVASGIVSRGSPNNGLFLKTLVAGCCRDVSQGRFLPINGEIVATERQHEKRSPL
jgi:hypothetical protein